MLSVININSYIYGLNFIILVNFIACSIKINTNKVNILRNVKNNGLNIFNLFYFILSTKNKIN